MNIGPSINDVQFFGIPFDLPTYPCLNLSSYKLPILLYGVRFWEKYLPTQKSDIIYGCSIHTICLTDKFRFEICFGKVEEVIFLINRSVFFCQKFQGFLCHKMMVGIGILILKSPFFAFAGYL